MKLQTDARADSWWTGAAMASIALFPFANLLAFHDYPLLTAEVAVLIALVISVSFILSRWSEVRKPGNRLLIVALMIGVAMLVQLDLGVWALLAVISIVLALGYPIRARWTPVIVVIFTVMSIVALVEPMIESKRPQATVASDNPNLPPILHIVLDGHQAVAGLPGHRPPRAMNQLIEANLFGRGFTLYSSAFSRYTATVDALDNLFDFRADPTTLYFQRETNQAPGSISQGRYFDALSRAGYRFRIVQTDEVDICSAIPASALEVCKHQRLPALRSLRQSSATLLQRTWRIAKTAMMQSRLLRALLPRYGMAPMTGLANFAGEAIDEYAQDVLAHGGGRVYLAHWMIPHSPFVYSPECQPTYDIPLWATIPVDKTAGQPPNTEQSRALRYSRYFDQLQCAHRLLARLFDQLDTAGVFDSAVIILHGDHGSRITTTPPNTDHRDSLTETNLRDAYSTLFAIRLPGQTGRMIVEPTALESALASALAEIIGDRPFSTPPGSFVYIGGDQRLERLDQTPFQK